MRDDFWFRVTVVALGMLPIVLTWFALSMKNATSVGGLCCSPLDDVMLPKIRSRDLVPMDADNAPGRGEPASRYTARRSQSQAANVGCLLHAGPRAASAVRGPEPPRRNVRCTVGSQGLSGPVVLAASSSAFDPKLSFDRGSTNVLGSAICSHVLGGVFRPAAHGNYADMPTYGASEPVSFYLAKSIDQLGDDSVCRLQS